MKTYKIIFLKRLKHETKKGNIVKKIKRKKMTKNKNKNREQKKEETKLIVMKKNIFEK
jgi:hypothetical protein